MSNINVIRKRGYVTCVANLTCNTSKLKELKFNLSVYIKATNAIQFTLIRLKSLLTQFNLYFFNLSFFLHFLSLCCIASYLHFLTLSCIASYLNIFIIVCIFVFTLFSSNCFLLATFNSFLTTLNFTKQIYLKFIFDRTE